MRGNEFGYDVRRITPAGQFYLLHPDCMGEGMKYSDKMRVRVLPDGRLELRYMDSDDVVRWSCPEKYNRKAARLVRDYFGRE